MAAEMSDGAARPSLLSRIFGSGAPRHRHAWSLIRSETVIDDEGDRAGKRYYSQCACGAVRSRFYAL